MAPIEIDHVSDTARWVAIYRAMETERPDAHFRDPYARKLAGERGEEIVKTMKGGKWMAWAMIVRTQVMDELILQTIADGADTVLNLACGLDARAYRLALPSSLRWIDVDFQPIIDARNKVLGSETPKCQHESVGLDLSDVTGRRALFARIGKGAKRVTVISEGLLIYLEREQVAGLADDLAAQPSFQSWIFDLAAPILLEWMTKRYKANLTGSARMKFAPPEGTAFFDSHGWRQKVYRGSMEESIRLHRTMPLMWLSGLFGLFQKKEVKEQWKKASGIVLMERR